MNKNLETEIKDPVLDSQEGTLNILIELSRRQLKELQFIATAMRVFFVIWLIVFIISLAPR